MADENKEPANNEPTPDPQSANNNNNPPTPPTPPTTEPPKDDDLTKKIRDVVESVLRERPGATNNGRLRENIEETARQMVEEASARLKSKEDEEKWKNDVESKLRAVTEKSPQKVRRLTKAMFGDPNKDDQ